METVLLDQARESLNSLSEFVDSALAVVAKHDHKTLSMIPHDSTSIEKLRQFAERYSTVQKLTEAIKLANILNDQDRQQPQPATSEQPADAGGNDIKPTPEYVEARRFVNFLESISITASPDYLGGVLVQIHHWDGLHSSMISGYEIKPQDQVSIAQAVSVAIGRAMKRIGKP